MAREVDKVREAYFYDATLTDAEYGMLIEEAELRDYENELRAEEESCH